MISLKHMSSLDFNGELGSIHIKLLEDDDTYILISLGYNHDMKFDMMTWTDLEICKNGIRGKASWMRQVSHGLEGSLFDKVANYLTDNELVGPII